MMSYLLKFFLYILLHIPALILIIFQASFITMIIGFLCGAGPGGGVYNNSMPYSDPVILIDRKLDLILTAFIYLGLILASFFILKAKIIIFKSTILQMAFSFLIFILLLLFVVKDGEDFLFARSITNKKQVRYELFQKDIEKKTDARY